jgi:hypothetical protein
MGIESKLGTGLLRAPADETGSRSPDNNTENDASLHKLSQLLGVPAGEIEQCIADGLEAHVITKRQHEALTSFFGVAGAERRSFVDIAKERDRSRAAARQSKDQAIRNLKRMKMRQRLREAPLPENTLDYSIYQFFTPERARSVGVSVNQLNLLLDRLQEVFGQDRDGEIVPPTVDVICHNTTNDFRRTPKFGLVSVEAMKKMLATENLHLKE